MVKKIISGGQTGADRAALDVAIELSIPHGGRIPKDRRTELGPLPDKYQLKEMPTDTYPARTEQNVIDSDGTLIVSHGKLTGGSALTRDFAKKHASPCLHVNLRRKNAFKAAEEIKEWIHRHGIEVLNVAGSRASEDPAIYDATVKVLKAVFFMDIIESEMPDPFEEKPYQPETVEDAVAFLISGMSLKDRTMIARMEEEELDTLQPTLGHYIRDKFGLWSGNDALMDSCRSVWGENDMQKDDASAVIMRELWKKLRETHAMKAVK
jgi:hypothetical protein